MLHEAGPAAGVLEAELAVVGIPHDLKVYPGARHAFFNDRWRAYDPAAAADSWQRVLAFSPSTSGGSRRDRAKVRAG